MKLTIELDLEHPALTRDRAALIGECVANAAHDIAKRDVSKPSRIDIRIDGNVVGKAVVAASPRARETPRSAWAEAAHLWATSRRVAEKRETLNICPCCGSAKFDLVQRFNDLRTHPWIAGQVGVSNYSLCRLCGLLFAAERESPEVARDYYEMFGEAVGKPYASEVIAATQRKGKMRQAMDLAESMKGGGLFKPGMRVLHIRCDAGALLRQILADVPDAQLFGLDYFYSNVVAAKESGLKNVAILEPRAIEIPFVGPFDLIITNHIFTHALKPHDDLETLMKAIAPDGAMFFYNELDHDLMLDEASPHFVPTDMISYHKQLFTAATFARFFKGNGLDAELLERRKSTMVFIARKLNAPAFEPASRDEMSATKKRVARWSEAADANRRRAPLVAWAKRTPGMGWVAARLQKKMVARAPKEKKAKAAIGRAST